MQGVIFTYRKRKQRDKQRLTLKKGELKAFVSKWGSAMFFAAMLVLGLGFGCACAGSLSESALKNLDFLFTTNLPQRLSGGAWGVFCAGFASDFLFLFAAFLMGMSLWGAAALPFIAFFKGFGIGVSAGYLLITYGLKGVLFYASVLLPGIVVFSVALVYELSAAYCLFKHLLRVLSGKTKSGFKEQFRLYLKSGLKYLALSFAAAVTDAVLWIGLAGVFLTK